jgi:hypothetical protein
MKPNKRFSAGKAEKNSLYLVAIMAAVLIFLSVLTRTTLLFKSAASVDFTFLNLLGLFGIGIFYDLINAAYFTLPLVLYIWLTPRKWWQKRWHRFVVYGIFAFFIFGLLFNAVSEWVFWDEFSSRFNFIAVDYLVYTNEVIGNIRQSYPVGIIVGALVLATAALLYLLKPAIKNAAFQAYSFKQRSSRMLAYVAVLLLCFFLINNKFRQFSDNTYVNELAGNGLYELFAAYRNNELDYAQFYQKIPDRAAFAKIREMIRTPESSFVDSNPFSIERKIVNPGKEKG